MYANIPLWEWLHGFNGSSTLYVGEMWCIEYIPSLTLFFCSSDNFFIEILTVNFNCFMLKHTNISPTVNPRETNRLESASEFMQPLCLGCHDLCGSLGGISYCRRIMINCQCQGDYLFALESEMYAYDNPAMGPFILIENNEHYDMYKQLCPWNTEGVLPHPCLNFTFQLFSLPPLNWAV